MHIAGGGIGLMTGTIAAVVQKGNRVHRLCGKLFFYGMLLASLSALVMSNLPGHLNVFLFAVGGFTLYMILTGYRILFLKRALKREASPYTFADYLICLGGAIYGLFLLVLSVRTLQQGDRFGLVPLAFGLICLRFVWVDVRLLLGKTPIRQSWMVIHLGRMLGALIAAYTAFLVVNIQIGQQWILWLLPSLIGGIFIAKSVRRYAPAKK